MDELIFFTKSLIIEENGYFENKKLYSINKESDLFSNKYWEVLQIPKILVPNMTLENGSISLPKAAFFLQIVHYLRYAWVLM